MKTYEIINPSDPLTFKAESLEIAAAVVLLIGGGNYGAATANNLEKTPILFGWEPWLVERGMWPLNAWIDANKPEIIVALHSVFLGKIEERAALDAELAALPSDDARTLFSQLRNDRLRTSLNNIQKQASDLAAFLSSPVQVTETVTP